MALQSMASATDGVGDGEGRRPVGLLPGALVFMRACL
jgi:hypothetical protein